MNKMPEVVTKVATLEEKIQTILDNQGKQDGKLDKLGLTMDGLSTRMNAIAEQGLKNQWEIERLYEKDGIVDQVKAMTIWKDKAQGAVGMSKWLASFVGLGTIFNTGILAIIGYLFISGQIG